MSALVYVSFVTVDSSADAEPDEEQREHEDTGCQNDPAPDWHSQVLPLVPGVLARRRSRDWDKQSEMEVQQVYDKEKVANKGV